MTAAAPLQIHGLPLGPLGTNCYVVHRQDSAAAIVFDPGGESSALLELLQREKLQVTAVCLTHGHGDHLGGVEPLLNALPAPPPPYYAPALEKDFLRRGLVNLSAWFGESVSTRPADHWLNGGEHLQLAGIGWRIEHTPGHTPGHLIWIAENAPGHPTQVLVGDLIFRESVGRTDFPGGSFHQLQQSIEKHIWTLPDDTELYPGHGPQTSVGHEKRNNPFVQMKG